MKCTQYTCTRHTVLGCGFCSCRYYDGRANEINAMVQP